MKAGAHQASEHSHVILVLEVLCGFAVEADRCSLVVFGCGEGARVFRETEVSKGRNEILKYIREDFFTRK